MKKEKRGKLGEALAEILLELVLTVILFAVGWGVLSLFGLKFDEVDPDLTVLLGIAVIAAIVGVIAVVIYFAKKKLKSKKEDNNDQNGTCA